MQPGCWSVFNNWPSKQKRTSHTHTHSLIPSYIHTLTLTCIHSHTPTKSLSHTQSHTSHAHSHTHTHSHSHTDAHSHTLTYTHIHAHPDTEHLFISGTQAPPHGGQVQAITAIADFGVSRGGRGPRSQGSTIKGHHPAGHRQQRNEDLKNF